MCCTKYSFATDFFREDFYSINNDLWDVQQNTGYVDAVAGVLSLGSTSISFPSIISKFNLNSYWVEGTTLEIKFRYTSPGFMGTGIGVGYTGLNRRPYYQFAFWNDSATGKMFYFNYFNNAAFFYCKSFLQQPYPSMKYWTLLDINDNDWITLRLFKQYRKYTIYYRVGSVFNQLYESYPDTCYPPKLFLGNPLTGGRFDWANLEVDYVRIFDEDVIKKKVIILPGLGASWNSKAIVSDEIVGDDEWKMTPFVKNYDRLISALEQNGLVKNQDYFVWNYDWRKPISVIEDKFSSFVNQNVGSNDKVDIIGHSLGGLVGRIWLQNNKDDTRIDKVISLGSPHQGVASAYEIWNGGRMTDSVNAASIALNVLLHLRGGFGSKRAEVIRNYAPVIKDLIPVYDYQKKNGMLVPISSSMEKNNYLLTANLNIEGLSEKIVPVLGYGLKTREYSLMTSNTVYDNVLGYWKDGRVLGYELGDGDETVLKRSAKFGNYTTAELSSNHGDIVDKSISNIMTEIGLSLPSLGNYENNLKNKMVLFLGSPAKLVVDCGDGAIESEDFILVDSSKAVCKVQIVGNDNGVYHLVYGLSDNDDWGYVEGDTVLGKIDEFWINPPTGKINPDLSLLYIKELVKRDLILLGLNESINKLNTDDYSGVLKDVFNYRKTSRENNVTVRVVKNLENLLMVKYKLATLSQARTKYYYSLQEKSLTDRISRLNIRIGVNPSGFGSSSYVMADGVLTDEMNALNKKVYSEVMAKSDIVSKYFAEVWPN